MRVPRRLQEQMLEVNQSVAVLTQSAGRSPTIDEIAVDTRLSPEDVLEALEAGRALVAAPIDRDDGQDGRGGVIDRRGQADAGLEHVEQRMIVAKLLDSLRIVSAPSSRCASTTGLPSPRSPSASA